MSSTQPVSLPLLQKLPPSPTSFIIYHSILRKQIKIVRKQLGLTETSAYDKVKESLKDGSFVNSMPFECIWVLVLNAERAWAYGMQLKTEYQTNSQGGSSAMRQHSIRRFTKAAKWANFLKENASKYLDERGTIEIEAYHNWLQGTVELEREKYADAARMFSEANKVYQQLATVGSMETRARYAKRSAEIANLLQYSQYELSRKSGDDSAELAVIQNLLTQGSAAHMLNDKLEQVLEEERTKQAASMETVTFLNREIAVQNERVRVSILKAQSLEKDLQNQKNTDQKLRFYEKLLLAYGDGVRILQEDVRKNASNSGQDYVEQSRLLNTYLNYNYLMSIVKRNELLVQNILRQMSNQTGGSDKQTRTPQEVAHLYDVILQNIEEMQDLPEIDSDSQLSNDLESKQIYNRSFKLYFLAASYEHAGKSREAHALLKHTLSVIGAAKTKAQKNSELLSNLNELEAKAKKDMLQGHAQSYLEANTAQAASSSVIANLDQYQSNDKVPELIAFPPNFEKIPCKPMFFDIAGNNVELPNFKEQGQQKKGWFGIW
eukprot:CAMPEP_0117444734 /NCGR_PEP_ID=MMETSP0759-20121206/5405_1 /TAXON_ID=63605 /ORGANISM="Percolomonas cosmopolitus, Strain WS" /LENGTH=547 /DNA_ID=CAMNT_0005236833 /DNA_START=10 /DNA_END=1653 /DNA_ORIENTATION=+